MRWIRASRFRRFLALPIGLLAAGVLALPAPGGAAGWQSPLIIPAAEFENTGVFPLEDKFWDAGGYFSGRGTLALGMVAPVQLPNGATVTKIEAAVVDLGDPLCSQTVTVKLRSFDFAPDGGVDDIITHATVASPNSSYEQIISTTAITSPVVNNLARGYFVIVTLCTQFQAFQGVRISYTE